MKKIIFSLVLLIFTTITSYSLDQQEAINSYLNNKKLEPIEGIYKNIKNESTYIIYKNQNEYIIKIIKYEPLIKKNSHNSGDIIGIYKKNSEKFYGTSSIIYRGECYNYNNISFFEKFFNIKKIEIKKNSQPSTIWERSNDEGPNGFIDLHCFNNEVLYKFYPLNISNSKKIKNDNETDFFNFQSTNSSTKSYLDYWWALILIAAVMFFIYTQTGNELKIKKINKYLKQKLLKKNKYKENKKDNFKDYLG